MSTLTVAKKDLRNVRRSRALWAGAIFLAVIAVLLAYANQGFNQSDAEAVRSTFQFLTIVLSLLLPLVALVVSYLAVAGEREGGGIKFLLSMPNTRRDIFAGKLLSRLCLVAGGVVFIYLAATSVSLTKHGAFPAAVVFGSFVVTLVYGGIFVNIGVALSASVASRGEAIGLSLAAYFVLVLLYIFPVIRLSNVVQAFHKRVLGMDANPDLYNAIEYTSPYRAYQKATNLAVPEDLAQRPFLDSAANAEAVSQARVSAGPAASTPPELPVYLTDEFSLVVIAVWLVVPLLVGYRTFNHADLE
jgi:ABC-2 type transport system permease protein